MQLILPGIIGLAWALILAVPLGASADDDPRAYLLASSCAACHGPDGQSPGSIPSLYGQKANFIAQALRDFKTGERSATIMNRLAKGYSDDEIALIAAWFESHAK